MAAAARCLFGIHFVMLFVPKAAADDDDDRGEGAAGGHSLRKCQKW